MYHGIDVSNWDAGAILPPVDFVICKATEGLSFIDSTFDGFINDALNHGMCVGAYHFASYAGQGKDEAEFFYSVIQKYEDFCYPWLDFECFNWDPQAAVDYCETFISRYYEISGVYPGIYISASLCSWFYDSWIPSKCELWVAGYPDNSITNVWTDTEPPYDVSPWMFPKIWQFTSQMQLSNSLFDANIGYYTTWFKPEDIEETLKIACKVILGEYGNGEERIKRLTDAGYNYNTIQGLVNRIYEVL